MMRKTIALPGRHDLDILPIQPIINSPLFQRLLYIKQLGMSYLVFMSAQHTRFEHSLGTYSLMLERTQNWQRDGMTTSTEAITLQLYALLHDIGHGPYSHASEDLCLTDHNVNGLSLITKLQAEIEECGGDMPLLLSLFKRTNPLAAANCHRCLGADKLDYTKRDAWYTTNAAGFRMGDLLNHTHFINKQLVVDTKILPEVMQLQMDYINMHDRVYFRQACIILQYFLQQIIAHAIESEDLSQRELPYLTDSELDAALLHAKSPLVRKLFEKIRSRKLPKPAVMLRAKEARTPFDPKGKSIKEYQLPLDQLEKFAIFNHRKEAALHEAAIANIAGIPPEDVLVTPVASPHRFIPNDVSIYTHESSIYSLRECNPHHYASMYEISTNYAAVRVCVQEEHREAVADPKVATPIFEYLMQIAA